MEQQCFSLFFFYLNITMRPALILEAKKSELHTITTYNRYNKWKKKLTIVFFLSCNVLLKIITDNYPHKKWKFAQFLFWHIIVKSNSDLYEVFFLFHRGFNGRSLDALMIPSHVLLKINILRFLHQSWKSLSFIWDIREALLKK